MILRCGLAAGFLLSGFAAAAQETTNVRFELRSGSLTVRAKIYTDDGDRVVETGELIEQQNYTATADGGIPVSAFTLVTVCALDFPGTTICPDTQLAPTQPRFNVNKAEAIGINSTGDTSALNRRRINRRTGSDSAERASITFNCGIESCGPSITSGRIVLNKVTGSNPVVFLYTTLGGTVVGDKIAINLAGANPAGIAATLASGTATINLGEEFLASRPAFDGVQIGVGNAATRFTFRLADMSFARPAADFVDFGCRIDLAQTDVTEPFKFTLAATSSEKFCPQNNDGILKLACSGKIPSYSGGAVTSSEGVECRISGSQCGIDVIFDADVKSIDVKADGTATLACEAAVGG